MSEHKEDDQSVEEAVMKYVGSLSGGARGDDGDAVPETDGGALLDSHTGNGGKSKKSKKRRGSKVSKRERKRSLEGGHSKKLKLSEDISNNVPDITSADDEGFIVDPDLADLEDPSVMMDQPDPIVQKALLASRDVDKTTDLSQYNSDGQSSSDEAKAMKDLESYVEGQQHDLAVDGGADTEQPQDKLNYEPNDQTLDIGLGDGSRSYDDELSNPLSKPLEGKNYQEVLPKVINTKQRNDTTFGNKITLGGTEYDVDVPESVRVRQLLKEAVINASKLVDKETADSVRAASKKGAGGSVQPDGRIISSKAFSKEEDEALEKFVNEYQIIEGVTRRQVCERIWNSDRPRDNFWHSIYQVLPYRTSASIYKHMRRKYHIFEQRGKWNKEEDEILEKLCKDKEGQWVEIGKVLGRMPEDCRDRWRNYVKCGGNRSANRWTAEEEEMLKRVVNEMMEEANGQYRGMDEGGNNIGELGSGDQTNLGIDDSNSMISDKKENNLSFKDVINWTIVSERMQGKRSRIQCRYKWNKMLKREASDRLDSRDEEDMKWLFRRIIQLEITDEKSLDWQELAESNPSSEMTPLEAEVCYDKLKRLVKEIKNKNPTEVATKVLAHFEYQASDDIETNKQLHTHTAKFIRVHPSTTLTSHAVEVLQNRR
ncbi:Myb-like domain profile [Nakaseomyces glabratus]